MTTGIQTAGEILDDARFMYSEALERLAAGDVRDAAEKAWCAAVRATDALIMARWGSDPVNTTVTRRRLDALAREDAEVKSLVGRFHTRKDDLHGDCFYLGMPPTPDSIRRIRETGEYIADARSLAGL